MSKFAGVKAVGKASLGRLARALVRRAPAFTPEQWQLAQDADGRLVADGHTLQQLARQFGTPLHVMRAGQLDATARAFFTAGCDPHASVKTHPSANVLRRLKGLGLGAEVVSHHEYRLALACGFGPGRIVANMTLPDQAWFDVLAGDGARLINLNGCEDIALAAARSRALGVRPRVGLRIAIGDWSERFGEPLHRAVATVGQLAAEPALDWDALHIHVGTLLRTAAEVQAMADDLAGFCAALWQAHGRLPRTLDCGGALSAATMDWVDDGARKLNARFAVPLPAPDPATVPTPASYCQILRRTLDALYAQHGCAPPKLIVEPGRALYAAAQLTLLGVRGARELGHHRLLLLDGGTNLLPLLQSAYHAVFACGPASAEPLRLSKLCGPLAHPGDVLVDRLWLPPLAAGDLVAVMDTGAYCQASSTQFSSLRPAQILLEGPEARLLRRAEVLDDFLACDLPATGVEP